jgi:pyruvate kinase
VSFPINKTKIVATIGPASDSPDVLRELILAGMNIVRLNFSGHAETIARVRAAAKAVSRQVAIMADMPGPKMPRTEFLHRRLRHKSLEASSANQAAGRKSVKIPRGFMPASGKMAFRSRISGLNRRHMGRGRFT